MVAKPKITSVRFAFRKSLGFWRSVFICTLLKMVFCQSSFLLQPIYCCDNSRYVLFCLEIAIFLNLWYYDLMNVGWAELDVVKG